MTTQLRDKGDATLFEEKMLDIDATIPLSVGGTTGGRSESLEKMNQSKMKMKISARALDWNDPVSFRVFYPSINLTRPWYDNV
jgi:hypothetical protein